MTLGQRAHEQLVAVLDLVPFLLGDDEPIWEPGQTRAPCGQHARRSLRQAREHAVERAENGGHHDAASLRRRCAQHDSGRYLRRLVARKGTRESATARLSAPRSGRSPIELTRWSIVPGV